MDATAIIILVVGTTVVPIGGVILILLLLAGRGRGAAKQAQSWPTTTGQILFSGTEPRRSHSSEGGYHTSHYPVVQYAYQIGGQVFQSNRLHMGTDIGYGLKRQAEKTVAPFPVGAVVPVYYNPANPADAVLNPTSPASKILLWVIALMFGILVFTAAISVLILVFVT